MSDPQADAPLIPFVPPPQVAPQDPPPPKRHPRTIAAEAQQVVTEAMRSFEQAVGGRKRAVEVLALAELDPKVDPETVEYVTGLIADPRNADKSLAQIAKEGGIDFLDLLRIYRNAMVSRAHLFALEQISQQIPAVVADVMRKAVPYTDVCSDCLGAATVTANPTKAEPNPTPQPCETCRGTGELLYPPSLEVQKLALQLGGLLKSGGLTIVQTQQNALIQANGAGGGPGDLFLKVQQAADEILFGTRPPTEASADPVIDAEPMPPATEADADATVER